MRVYEPVIECQDCGYVLRKMTSAESKRAAQRPYDFEWWCYTCRKDRLDNGLDFW
jgi:hypothetical protein